MKPTTKYSYRVWHKVLAKKDGFSSIDTKMSLLFHDKIVNIASLFLFALHTFHSKKLAYLNILYAAYINAKLYIHI